MWCLVAIYNLITYALVEKRICSFPVKLMLAIRRVLNSCIQTDCDLTEMNDSNKENSTVRDADANREKKKRLKLQYSMLVCMLNNPL